MHSLSAEALDAPAGVMEPTSADPAVIDPDAELVVAWQGGDLAAFETLVRRHEGRIFRMLFRMLGTREEAEDATQEAFLSLHRHGHRFRREARFSTFLYRVAANAALNRRRSLGRARARERQLALRQAAGSDLPSAPRDPEGAASGAEVQARVQQALQTLPPDLRAAVVLYDLEGQSYRDVAEVLGVPEGTVKSRIHRGRQALREQLREFVRNQGSGDPT
ncbi:MAG: RNA polymerase sigma factor [Planctomycetota bacterium]|jgi:RNA polymerase sigma-70 factor (ECF subfamily)